MERPDWSPLHDILRDVRGTLENLDDIRARSLAVTGVAWSEDELVKAVVGPSGQLISLEIDPRVYWTPDSKELAALIVATVRDAIAVAAEKGKRILAESLPKLPSDLRGGPVAGMDMVTLIGRHDAELGEGTAGNA